MTVDEIREQVNLLAPADQGILAGEILESLPPSDYDVSDKEVEKRFQELESGEVEEISFDELKNRLGR